jgi:lysophospholipase L1-like esterase
MIMKKFVLLIGLAMAGLGLFAQTNVYFFDFGPNDVTNGNITTNPDPNGKHWNNITNPSAMGSAVNLVNQDSQATSAFLQVSSDFQMNGILNGGLLSPADSLLGEFAVATATQDYFFTTNSSSLEIGGLAPGKGYVFSFFGTRNTSSTRITSFTLSGNNSYTGNQQTSGTGMGAGGYNANNNSILLSDTVYADVNGKISLDVSVVQGGFAYLGCMKMVEIAANGGGNTALRSFLVDLGPNDVTNGNITLNPDKNGNYWNNLTQPTPMATPVQLVDTDSNQVDAKVSILVDFLMNGIQNGGLLTPVDSLLDDFAINTATQDYFFTVGSATLAIDDLDPNRAYVFNLFGSRNTNIVRISEYEISGANTVIDSLQTSGAGIGGMGYDGNNSTILVTDPVRPDANGRITLKLSVAAGGFAYLNTMRIDEIAIKPAYYVDFGPNDGTNGNLTVSPDKNGTHWNNVTDPSAMGDTLLLVNGDNQSAGAYLKVTQDFSMNGILNGGLLLPADSLLGDFAIPTVTQDYFFTTNSGSLEIGGLDTTKGYVFSLFGTRNSSSTRISRYTFNGDTLYVDSLQTSGANLGGMGYDGNNSSLMVTDTLRAKADGKITLSLEVATGGFAYLGALKMEEVFIPRPPEPVCPQKDSLLIAVMGSSVADGFGATNSEGYAYQYTQLLDDRFNNGLGADWDVTNISIGGNSTVSLLNRWDNDLLPLCSRYVIYGVSLGNEGIRSQGQAAFDQFRDNMLILIDRARNNGIEPVVVNCYARADFDATDYAFTKDMNLLIHSWDVASVNVLGTIDEGSGKWATGYEADPFHPNTAGHIEMSYAFVPSLFDALNEGKAQPQQVDTTFLAVDKSSTDYLLEFSPDGEMHSFTYTFDIRTSGDGPIAAFTTDNGGYGGMVINASNGALDYVASSSAGISGSSVINDGNWHQVTLTHYYAWGKTLLYVDGTQEGTIDEQLEPATFVLSEQNAPTADYKEWKLYRAGMTPDEAMAMANGDFLKSSLAVYAPLDGQSGIGPNTLANLAQSTNPISQQAAYPVVTDLDEGLEGLLGRFQVFPNPSASQANLLFSLAKPAEVRLVIYDLQGREVAELVNEKLPTGEHQVGWAHGASGLNDSLYLAVLQVEGKSSSRKLMIQR